jgi:hypothetical protein
MRSGRYVKQVEGYSAFIPAPLPPNPPIKMDDPELIRLLLVKQFLAVITVCAC